MKIKCPQCGGHNFYHTDYNGMGYCFNCAYVEHNKQYVALKRSEHKEFIRATYQELSLYYHSCLEENHRQYLHKRGITDQSIEKFRIGYCPASTHILYAHPLIKETGLFYEKPVLEDRIVFPYFSYNEIIDLRGRSLTDKEMPYKSLIGSSFTRWADYAYNDKITSETIVLTEGEIKAIVGDQYGFDVRAFPGINSQRKYTNTNQKVVVCFDNQENNRRELFRSIETLSRKESDLYVATLPLLRSKKQDIDSFILQYGSSDFRDVINSSLPFLLWKQYIWS